MNSAVLCCRICHDSRTEACFLFASKASVVMPMVILREAEGGRGEARKMVNVRSNLWPMWRWSKVPPTATEWCTVAEVSGGRGIPT